MKIADYIATVAAFISALSVIVMSLQIRADISLNRINQTFIKIEELDKLLYHRSELKKLIKEIRLIDDCKEPVSIKAVGKIFDKNDMFILEIINFFEAMSLSVFSKNIDQDILFKIYGQRLMDAYEKLHPFILYISDKYKDPNKKPYQHFEQLYDKLQKKYGGKHGYRKSN